MQKPDGTPVAAEGAGKAVAQGQGTPKASLPTPAQREAEPPIPVEEPAPPRVGYSEAVREISRLYPAATQPLKVQGRVPILLYDLDGDRQAECLALGIPAEGVDPRQAARLDDANRLFDEEAQPVAFSLLLFENREGSFHRFRSFDLGERLVFERLQAVSLYTARALPLIVLVSFQTAEGRDSELFVFDGSGLKPRTRVALAENSAAQYRLRDIDGDGMLDLLVRERAMEEGTGFETFLTWYRWNGRGFVEYRTRNVVRNLNAFLSSAETLMFAGEPDEALRGLAEPQTVAELRREGLTDEAILARVLGLTEAGLSALPPLREVVFPPFLEDPFTSEDERGSYFTITYRLIDASGTSYIARARLYMAANPFSGRQFAFAPPVD